MPFSKGVLNDGRDGFSWIQGEDYLDSATIMLGCDGIVSGLCNDRIEPDVEMLHAAPKKTELRFRHVRSVSTASTVEKSTICVFTRHTGFIRKSFKTSDSFLSSKKSCFP